jgi:hypothetical protein
VGIEKGGNTLTVDDMRITGSLRLREQCVGRYDVVLQLLYDDSTQ